jgi:hypothetical protein
MLTAIDFTVSAPRTDQARNVFIIAPNSETGELSP